MTYKVQIDDLVRDATADEIALIEQLAASKTKMEEEALAREEAKNALLDRLGITDEEAKLLLG